MKSLLVRLTTAGEISVPVQRGFDGLLVEPVANPDAVSTERNTEVIIAADDLLKNDRDADGDTLSISGIMQNPSNGKLADNGNGTYTPDNNFSGLDQFEYTVSDGKGGEDTDTVYIGVKLHIALIPN